MKDLKMFYHILWVICNIITTDNELSSILVNSTCLYKCFIDLLNGKTDIKESLVELLVWVMT